MPAREQPAPPARPAPPPRPTAPERERAAPPERAAREPRLPQPPGPAKTTQITHLLGLVGKLGLNQSALEAEIGKPVDQMTFLEARRWLSEYQRRLRERRALAPETVLPAAAEARHRAHLPESVDGFEANYLTQHQQAGTRLRFKLFNGETFDGHILGYGPYNIVIRQDDGTELNLQKLAIAYYHSLPNAGAAGDQEGAPEGGAV
jgi:hypothetical protein